MTRNDIINRLISKGASHTIAEDAARHWIDIDLYSDRVRPETREWLRRSGYGIQPDLPGLSCSVTANGYRLCSTPLTSLKQTVSEIVRLGQKYASDIPEELTQLSLADWYLYARDRVPYRKDPKGFETISRPKIILDTTWSGPIDCDDKTVLCVAWFEMAGDYRYAVDVIGNDAGTNPVWHVYPVVWMNTGTRERPKLQPVAFDCTYPRRSAMGKMLYDNPRYHYRYSGRWYKLREAKLI
jgi:hypothetical protein